MSGFDYPLFDFASASLLMALGIGTDVALATFARAGDLRQWRLAVYWILGVSLTHTLFPMLGYLLTYFSIQSLPWITPLVGIVAFVCIGRYIQLALQDAFESGSDNRGNEQRMVITLGLILAVSWDALWSGPAKSAQVIGWPELLVWLSFVIVGVIIALMSMLSLATARRWADRMPKQWQRASLWLQFSIIGYFGLLALLRYTLELNLYWWQLLIMSALVMAAAMGRALRRSTESLVAP